MLSMISNLFGFQSLENSRERENTAISLLTKLLQFGILLLLVFSVGIQFYGTIPWKNAILGTMYHFAIMCLVAISCFIIGGLTGFLFGIPIPKIKGKADTVGNDNGKDNGNNYSDNDNLVQVSDWLTKIIVGVGLTQISSIQISLNELGETVGPAFYDGNLIIGKVVAIATVLYFVVVGFTLSYLWTRLYFKKMLVKSDNEIVDMMKSYLVVGLQPTDFRMKQYSLPSYTKKIEPSKPSPPEDPQKYQWGEQSVSNGRKITAVVTPVEWSSDYFNVKLKVSSTDPAKELKGKVTFHLHPSFRNSDPEVTVINGEANLNLLAYGAFTVGAEADMGDTLLELDLAELPGVPTVFKSR